MVLTQMHVASFEQLIKSTNSTSPCTRPYVFLLAFLETNSCPTLYSTFVSGNNIKGLRYSTFLGSPC